MGLEEEFPALAEALVETVVVCLAEGSAHLHLRSAALVDQLHELINIQATLLSQLVAIRSLAALGEELVILVVEVLELEKGDSRKLALFSGEVS